MSLPPPSRWKTPEFYVYYVVFITVVPVMFKIPIDLSREDNPNYILYSRRLQQGWILGRKVDNSDLQYSTFRNNIPTLAVSIVIYLLCSHIFNYFIGNKTPIRQSTQFIRRSGFFLSFSLLFLSVLYGVNLIKILVIASINYVIAKTFKGSILNPTVTWIFGISILFLNDWYNGYRFGSIDNRLEWLDADHLRGINRGWHNFFNFTLLRFISFNMDFYWSLLPREQKEQKEELKGETFPKDDRSGSPLNERDRIETSCFPTDYNYIYYLTYILYTPLYMAGPIITFNNFISQLRYPSTNVKTSKTIQYAVRLVAVIILMEFLLHYMYVVAISKDRAWKGDTPAQLSMIGFWNLMLIWLKLLIIWRTFRLWAMADGIDTTENMIRCMCDNYSAQGFWKSWHRSFNRWLIRYVYIPLGGSKYFAFNMWPVFTFVAIWHDIQLRLLAWAWLICLFVLPEIIATTVFSPKKWGNWPYYRHLCACGAVLNILMMMAGNLVGFCLGLDGLRDMLHEIFLTFDGIKFLLTSSTCLFVAVHIMFEWREEQRRRGDPNWKL